jgi:hypothetical protein
LAKSRTDCFALASLAGVSSLKNIAPLQSHTAQDL